mgnify:CR=1 FL=1
MKEILRKVLKRIPAGILCASLVFGTAQPLHSFAETNLKVLSTSNISKVLECSDSILTPNIHVTSEKWDGGHTYITITFYDYDTGQSIAVLKSSGIGLSIPQDQNIALRAIRKKLKKVF